MVAAVADAAADKERTQYGFRQDTRRKIVGESARIRKVVHLGGFVGADYVDLFADKGWQGENAMQVANLKQIVLVAEQLVLTVSAEAKRRPQEELRNTGVLCAQRGATLRGL